MKLLNVFLLGLISLLSCMISANALADQSLEAVVGEDVVVNSMVEVPSKMLKNASCTHEQLVSKNNVASAASSIHIKKIEPNSVNLLTSEIKRALRLRARRLDRAVKLLTTLSNDRSKEV